MKKLASLALSAPILLALAACGDAEETDTATTDMGAGASAVPLDEPEIPLDTFEDARDQDTGTEPVTDPAVRPTPTPTPEVNEGDAAIDDEITGDPTITESS